MEQRINGRTNLLGVIGNPIEHTLSPVIHNTLNAILDQNQVYVPFYVTEKGLEQAIAGAYELNIQGLNVTVPYKNQVMRYLQKTDIVAERIGAVNTLVRKEQGYQGYNTDMPGLLRAIQTEGIELYNRKVVILGAGGAARAVAYMCMQEQANEIYMLNRTVEKAQRIAEDMNACFDVPRMHALALEDWRKIPQGSWIVFQCTSMGLSPHADAVVLEDMEFYRQVAVGVDLIYNPAVTKFMKLVQMSGGKAYNGLKMLLYQGIIAYELWNQVQITNTQADMVYDRLYEAIHPSGDNIVLIGFMGSGKTTIGRVLEQKYGYSFLDTDAYIEKREGRCISEIFEVCGEEYFRELETVVLQELVQTVQHSVIATGGGMPLCRENQRLLRELGQVAYLQASEEEIWNRVKGSHDRPLLEGEQPRQRIHSLMELRQSLYEQAAHIRVMTDEQQPEEIAEHIYQSRKGWKA